MKRIISFFIIVLLFTTATANDYVKVTPTSNLEYHNHDIYEVWYDTVLHNPAFVIWDLTFEEATLSDAVNGNRSSSFKKCGSSAKHADYSGTGYDRGHMCPNNDRDWSKESAAETFRMCNVCPQLPSLNRGSWKHYEEYGHQLAKKYQLVTIACGPIYSSKVNCLDKGNVTVPDSFFKVFIVNGKVYEALIFNQDGSYRSAGISEIERVTSLAFILL